MGIVGIQSSLFPSFLQALLLSLRGGLENFYQLLTVIGLDTLFVCLFCQLVVGYDQVGNLGNCLDQFLRLFLFQHLPHGFPGRIHRDIDRASTHIEGFQDIVLSLLVHARNVQSGNILHDTDTFIAAYDIVSNLKHKTLLFRLLTDDTFH